MAHLALPVAVLVPLPAHLGLDVHVGHLPRQLLLQQAGVDLPQPRPRLQPQSPAMQTYYSALQTLSAAKGQFRVFVKRCDIAGSLATKAIELAGLAHSNCAGRAPILTLAIWRRRRTAVQYSGSAASPSSSCWLMSSSNSSSSRFVFPAYDNGAHQMKVDIGRHSTLDIHIETTFQLAARRSNAGGHDIISTSYHPAPSRDASGTQSPCE